MTRRGIRILLILGLAAAAGLTGWQVWTLEAARRQQHADADRFQALTLQLTRALLDVRASQRAYLSSSQGIAFWKPRVDVQLLAMRDALQSLKRTGLEVAATGPTDSAALDDAALDALGEVTRLERRMAEHVEAGRLPHADDLMYADNVRTSLALERAIDAALAAHRQDLAVRQTRMRGTELIILGLSAVIGALLGMLITVRGRPQEAEADTAAVGVVEEDAAAGGPGGRPGERASKAGSRSTDAGAGAAAAGSRAIPLPATGGGAGTGAGGIKHAPAPPHLPIRADAAGASAAAGQKVAEARTGSSTPRRSDSGAPATAASSPSSSSSSQTAPRRSDAAAPDVTASQLALGHGQARTGPAGAGATGRTPADAGAAGHASTAGPAAAGGHTGAGDQASAGGYAGGGYPGAGGHPGAAGPGAGADLGADADTLRAAADLCVSLARVGDADGLQPLLARFADQLDAIGVIVWLEDASGQYLTPAMTHGYPAETLALLHAIDRDDDNATAHAFRVGEPQIVPGRTAARATTLTTAGPAGAAPAASATAAAAMTPAPAAASTAQTTSPAPAPQTTSSTSPAPGSDSAATEPGAIVVPMLTATGCVGVVAAELRHGREHDPTALALARIVAAQLATLTGPSPADR